MLKEKLSNRAVQIRFLRFLVVGGTVTLTQFVGLGLIKTWVASTMAFSLSWFVAAGVHYSLNRFWALPSERRDTGRQFLEYLSTVAMSYLVNLGGFKLCQDAFGLSVMWAAFCAIPPSTVLVFLILNFRVFRAKAG